MNENNKGIKLNMDEYKVRKQCGKTSLTKAEKEARIYDLAKKLRVQIGVSR